jgi:ABC-2 type transport system ATP-binding protein
MRQRLGLALALMHQPEVIILDDPTHGLDPAAIHESRALLLDLPREHGITVLLSSHLLSEVEQIADQIGIIDRGRLLFQGSLDQLKARHENLVELRVDRPVETLRELAAMGCCSSAWMTAATPCNSTSSWCNAASPSRIYGSWKRCWSRSSWR